MATGKVSSSSGLKRRACTLCSKRKVACSGEEPCQKCSKRGLVCTYQQRKSAGTSRSRNSTTLSVSPEASSCHPPFHYRSSSASSTSSAPLSLHSPSTASLPLSLVDMNATIEEDLLRDDLSDMFIVGSVAGDSKVIASRALDSFLAQINSFIPLVDPSTIAESLCEPVNSTSEMLINSAESLDVNNLRLARGALLHAARSLGALAMGLQPSNEMNAAAFAAQARDMLGKVFDVPLEEVASALLCLSLFYSRTGGADSAELYLSHAHSICLHLEEFPQRLRLCIEHMTCRQLKIELKPEFMRWEAKSHRLLHLISHTISAICLPETPPTTEVPTALRVSRGNSSPMAESTLTWIAKELQTNDNVGGITSLIASGLSALLLLVLKKKDAACGAARLGMSTISRSPAVLRAAIAISPIAYQCLGASCAVFLVNSKIDAYMALRAALMGNGTEGLQCALPLAADYSNWVNTTCPSPSRCIACIVKAVALHNGDISPAFPATTAGDMYASSVVEGIGTHAENPNDDHLKLASSASDMVSASSNAPVPVTSQQQNQVFNTHADAGGGSSSSHALMMPSTFNNTATHENHLQNILFATPWLIDDEEFHEGGASHHHSTAASFGSLSQHVSSGKGKEPASAPLQMSHVMSMPSMMSMHGQHMHDHSDVRDFDEIMDMDDFSGEELLDVIVKSLAASEAPNTALMF